MPIGDTLVAILHSLQHPRMVRARMKVSRAAGPLARPLARWARRGVPHRALLRLSRR